MVTEDSERAATAILMMVCDYYVSFFLRRIEMMMIEEEEACRPDEMPTQPRLAYIMCSWAKRRRAALLVVITDPDRDRKIKSGICGRMRFYENVLWSR